MSALRELRTLDLWSHPLVRRALICATIIYAGFFWWGDPRAAQGVRAAGSTTTERDDVIIVATARDSGLKMTLTAPFVAWLLNWHAIAGLLLISTVLVQVYYVIPRMAQRYAEYAVWHRRLGYSIISIMVRFGWNSVLDMSIYTSLP